jgi:hypothetical protein
VWTASIALVVESRPEDSSHVAALGAAVASGARKLFSFISQDDLFSQVCCKLCWVFLLLCLPYEISDLVNQCSSQFVCLQNAIQVMLM